jgi:hypothetical protein
LIVFATITALLPIVLMTAAFVGLDLYLHKRAEKSAGLNRWGYRGPVVGRKQPGETRIVVLGGSTAFGYGVTWSEAAPAVLERQLNTRHPDHPVSVVNLGFNNEGAYAYRPTLEDFRFLNYDIAVLFDGYNDMKGDDAKNKSLFRHASPVFRLTGYYPILPLVFEEKAMLIRSGGNLGAAYAARLGKPGEQQTVFRPSLKDRASATALESAAAVSESLGRQLERIASEPSVNVQPTTAAGCGYPWSFYCQSMYSAVEYALALNKRVVVVLQPRMLAPVRLEHMEQQGVMAAMLKRHFGGDARLSVVDLANAVDLANVNDSFDAMHLTADGVGKEVTALVAALPSDLIPAAGSAR